MDTVTKKPSVGLFVTCLIDLFRPSAAFATLRLLEMAGCAVSVPDTQTCCGQPAYNAGDRKSAEKIAKTVIETFEAFDYVVAPSGSCIGMLRCHYPEIVKTNKAWRERAENLAKKSFELTEFLVDAVKLEMKIPQPARRIAMHDSCSALRELGVQRQPRQLLPLTEIENSDRCCGFGGLFSVKYGDISGQMADKKAAAIQASGAEVVTSCDFGCLMNIEGRLKRLGSDIKVRHIAELLAEILDAP